MNSGNGIRGLIFVNYYQLSEFLSLLVKDRVSKKKKDRFCLYGFIPAKVKKKKKVQAYYFFIQTPLQKSKRRPKNERK